jgi:hypothetical protein
MRKLQSGYFRDIGGGSHAEVVTDKGVVNANPTSTRGPVAGATGQRMLPAAGF